MSKDLLTKEEIEDLLSSPAEPAETELPASDRPVDRSGELSELTLRYWQQTVVQMQREIAELRLRVDALEKASKGKEQLKSVAKNKSPAGSQQGLAGKADVEKERKPDPIPSRKEKYKSQRGKWF